MSRRCPVDVQYEFGKLDDEILFIRSFKGTFPTQINSNTISAYTPTLCNKIFARIIPLRPQQKCDSRPEIENYLSGRFCGITM